MTFGFAVAVVLAAGGWMTWRSLCAVVDGFVLLGSPPPRPQPPVVGTPVVTDWRYGEQASPAIDLDDPPPAG